ncbi:unannotated protein [freshwater metagenome]|uniref:Unannotated protein n=1 Tax=freshwater metagenome TaxID=449393 RepID=A0A6J6U419_9ZZZZ
MLGKALGQGRHDNVPQIGERNIEQPGRVGVDVARVREVAVEVERGKAHCFGERIAEKPQMQGAVDEVVRDLPTAVAREKASPRADRATELREHAEVAQPVKIDVTPAKTLIVGNAIGQRGEALLHIADA